MIDFENNIEVQKLADRLKKKIENLDVTLNDEDILEEIEFALLEYYNDRHYEPTDSQPFESVYSGIIIQLAISSILKRGAEGEKAHSEGGVSRNYDNASGYPLSLTRKIIPLVKGVG